MTNRRILPLLLTLLAVAFVGLWAWIGLKSPPVSEPAAIITTPARWQRIDAGQFSLYAPAGTRLRKVRGADSVYGDIIGPNTCLRFNVGTGVGILADKYPFRDDSQSEVVVDRRRATVRKAVLSEAEQAHWFGDCGAPLYIGLYLPRVLPDGAGIAIEGTAQNEDVRDQIETIFRSIRFARTR